MLTLVVAVADKFSQQHGPKMLLVNDDDVVKALSA
jgi:hypothetical protein